jgi:TonB family protein
MHSTIHSSGHPNASRFQAAQFGRLASERTEHHLSLLVIAAAFILSACTTQLPPGGVYEGSKLDQTHFVGPPSDKYVSPPSLISGESPVYPISLLQERLNGHAVIEFTIAEDGTVKDFVVVEADNEYQAAYAIDVIKKWSFRPIIKDGQPVEQRARQRIVFKPHDAQQLNQ